ncbi:MAG: hypothetical protein KGN02_13155 [bacterium]|nr:hypothetical protein [bacterium]
MIVGLLLLAVFLAFAVLMYRRLLPAIVAVPAMTVAMALVAGLPIAQIGTIVVSGASSLASVYVAVIFGALLGRVTMDTGIARALVNLAAEYGGERPFALALALCAIVALLFTSLSGLGAIIMVGSIVLPIMMTTGVPRSIAATLFLLSFALGFIFNIVNWKFYTQYFAVAPEQMTRYALVLAAIDACALVIYAVVAFRRERGYATFAVKGEEAATPRVPAVALVTPVLPLVLYYAFHLDPTLAFILAALFGVLVTRPRRAIPTLVAAAIRGVEDVAPAVLLFIGIGMLLTATRTPQFAAALAPFAGTWVRNPVAFVAIFGLASPLALYRGPLNPFGVGIAIFTILLAAHALPPVLLVAAVMAVVQVQNVCDPTNTANVWVANFTGVSIDEIMRRTLPWQVGVATAAALAIVLFGNALFGVRAFASLVPPAYADAPSSGLVAPPSAAHRIAVDDDRSALARDAAEATIAALARDGYGAFAAHENPNASDCAHKTYAAYLFVTTSSFALVEGTDLDVGLRLEDCGGWIVEEWHDHAVAPGAPQPERARALALEGVRRLEAWAASDPVRAKALFTRGLALAPSDPPTYFYTLFKTVDGYMRAYVRAGGPAYDAGLRTNDIVDKLDGKFWWEYGTYQTQLRAYDGKPHRFEVERNGSTYEIQLGAPLVPAHPASS